MRYAVSRAARLDIAIAHDAANAGGWKGEKIAIPAPLYDSGYIAPALLRCITRVTHAHVRAVCNAAAAAAGREGSFLAPGL